VLFGFGITVVNPSTVVPALVRALTPSAPLIGLVETIRTGAWLLPQLFVAWWLSGRTIGKRHLLVPYCASRLSLALIAPVLLLAGAANPSLSLMGVFVCLFLFFFLDSLGSLPWFDLFSMALSPVHRSRLIGAAQVLSGAGGIAIGFLVAAVLAAPSLGFPSSYAVLFAVAGAFMALELTAISFLRVPSNIPDRQRIPLRAFLPWVAGLLSRDRDFRTLIISRLLVGASGLAIPFYIIFALDVLRLGPESVGVFTAAQVVGSIASAPVMAWLSERRGTRSVVRLVAGMAALLPVIGLILFLSRSGIGQALRLAIASAIFFLLGGVNNGNMAGFTNYLMEYAPGAQRPVYIGLANTLNGLTLVAPVVGGWILAGTSYPILFVVAAIVSGGGLAATRWLREPRAAGNSNAP
jgi:hypothetical protein